MTGCIRPDFTLDMSMLGRPQGPDDAPMMEYFLNTLKSATSTSTMPLTVLTALEDTHPQLSSMQRLTIHIVGATGREALNLMIFEEIVHLLPSLKHLYTVLIGPKLGADNSGQEVEMECCPECTSQGRRRTFSSHHSLYHEYAASAAYAKPDLAVLFHSGRSQEEKASWAPTTRYLVDSGTCTLCTTYTKEEQEQEVAELKSMDAKFVVEPEVNRWKSLTPIPDFMVSPEHSVYYLNYYRYVFQGKM